MIFLDNRFLLSYSLFHESYFIIEYSGKNRFEGTKKNEKPQAIFFIFLGYWAGERPAGSGKLKRKG
jgi:hypothetical protein